MLKTIKNKTEIITETIEFYSNNPRAGYICPTENRWRCFYDDGRGNFCAVGRCLTDEGRQKAVVDSWGDIDWVRKRNRDISEVDFQSYFEEGYGGHSEEFWRDLQCLHDFFTYWSDGKLNEEGEQWKRIILKKWADK